jgi:hypothetical protein
MKRVKKTVSVITDLEAETVIVEVDGVEAAKALFKFDGTQILVSNVDTEEVYQKCGYGRLLLTALKCIAQQKKMPLVLDSLDDAVPFYEKVGMLHLNDPEVQKRVIFGNVKKSDFAKEIDNDDFVWIPKGLKHKPTINL